MRERISKLSGGVAIIDVGGITEVEMKERKLRIEDALNATKAAVKGGVVAGGGTALVKVAEKLQAKFKKAKLSRDIMTGINIVINSLDAPIVQIADNAGEHGEIIADTVRRNKSNTFGFDALRGEFVDMVQEGILDPARVTKSALRNASSIASMILTSEAAIIELPKKEPTLSINTEPGAMYM